MTVLTALNGRIPAGMLVLIERGQSLRTDAAASWHRMEAAGMPRGCLRSGYRNLALQGVLVISGATIARPGQSFHGEGTAADTDEPARTWIRAHGSAYGWAKDHVPNEPWHMEYDPTRDQHAHTAPTPTPVTAKPARPTVQEDDMRLIYQPEKGVWIMGAGFAHHLDPEEWVQFQQYPHELHMTTIPAGPAGQRVFDLHLQVYTQRNA